MIAKACRVSLWGNFFLFPFRRQVSRVQTDDVVLVNIVDNSMNGVEFDMFVRASDNNAVLNQQTLLQAVKVCV